MFGWSSLALACVVYRPTNLAIKIDGYINPTIASEIAKVIANLLTGTISP